MLLLDAGALLALERDDRLTWRRLEMCVRDGVRAVTHAGVIGQVWRGGQGRQARLAVALRGVEIVSLDDGLGRRAGVLLGRAGAADIVDAALVALAGDDDRILTSDAADIQALVDVFGRHVDVVPV
ncbi:MAG TPA: hypothetical protein VNU01_10730 [Egibacteraceae bacterium]|nr:hypothetical protein [Egibacteraceae bacterium]